MAHQREDRDMRISRRRFLHTASVLAGRMAMPVITSRRSNAADAIKVGAMHDRTGSHGIYGKEMDDGIKFVVDEINNSGGVLGRQLALTAYDTQSNMQNYAQYAPRPASETKADVVFAGISSSSRETVRPILDRYKILYFYNTFY